MAVVVGLLLAGCGGGGGDPSPIGEITVAPGGDVLVSQDRNPIVARNSPVLAVNPLQPTNMVVVDRVDRPDFTAAVHVTNNGGTNWQDVALKMPAGVAGKLFAPVAAYDARGVLYVSYVVLTGAGNSPDSLWVARSGDGGLTFDEPSKITGTHAFHTTLAADPKGRRLFAAWLQSNETASECPLCFAGTGLPIMVSRSDDGGRTWAAPVRVSDEGRMRVGAPSLAVDPDGNPAVLCVDYATTGWTGRTSPVSTAVRSAWYWPARPTGACATGRGGSSTPTWSPRAASSSTCPSCPASPSPTTATWWPSGPIAARATPTSSCAAPPTTAGRGAVRYR
ncbi:MAG: sialidase family protein [Acidimicrobiales bacterium]